MIKRKSRGRPRKGTPGGKTAALTARITQQLRDELDAAATRAGRSLSDEIEDRLLQSFHLEKAHAEVFRKLGGKESYAVFLLLAQVIKTIELSVSGLHPAPWLGDAWTFDQVKIGIDTILDQLRKPLGEAKRPQNPGFRPETFEHIGETTALTMWQQLLATSPSELRIDKQFEDGRVHRFSDTYGALPLIRNFLSGRITP